MLEIRTDLPVSPIHLGTSRRSAPSAEGLLLSLRRSGSRDT